MFQRDDWTLFRNLSTLGQKAGVPRERLGELAIKELADNALDAGAHCVVTPMNDDWIAVGDDGPGIDGTDEEIASLFSIRRPLTSSKLVRLPTRGALGNGLRVVAGVILASRGGLIVTTKGRTLTLRPNDDGHTEVVASSTSSAGGTIVTVKFGGEVASSNLARMANKAIAMRGASRFEGNTSAHWYDADSFYELLQGAADMRLGDLLDRFDGMKQGFLLQFVGKVHGNVSRAIGCGHVAREDAEQLLGGLRERAKAPKATALGEVGEEAIDSNGYAKKTGEMVLKPGIGKLAATVPCVIEVWAKRSTSPSAEIYVNRTPVTAKVNAYEGGTGHRATTIINGCGLWHRFKTGKAPMALTICVTTPYMSITTDGKEPDLKPLVDPIGDAIASACRKARVATSEGRPTSKKDIIVRCLPLAVAKASGNGSCRFSLRQLFYAVRPYMLNAGCDEPDYGYFATVIAEHENEHGQIKGIYRDARGILYHPHTGETIALGTINVEKYQRPEYRFNKVLYVEKGGFFELLKDARWPERNDCALMTSQGFASDAARDLCDLIGDTDEEVKVFCVHDADGYGTCIYEKLVEGSKNRPRRLRVQVINLGLDPAEAVAMDLDAEKVERKKGEVPVANYIAAGIRGWHWKDWLQSNRIELNAMTSPQFLEWLDRKMEAHGERVGKVVPPRDVLVTRLAAVTEEHVRAAVTARLLREADVEYHVARAMRRVDLPTSWDVDAQVKSDLLADPTAPWEKPVAALAVKAAREATE